jgi:hypothetical protein
VAGTYCCEIEVKKGGPLLERDKQDRRQQDSEILLDLETASNGARNTRESSHIHNMAKELVEPDDDDDDDDDVGSNIDITLYRRRKPEAVKERIEIQQYHPGSATQQCWPQSRNIVVVPMSGFDGALHISVDLRSAGGHKD